MFRFRLAYLPMCMLFVVMFSLLVFPKHDIAQEKPNATDPSERSDTSDRRLSLVEARLNFVNAKCGPEKGLAARELYRERSLLEIKRLAFDSDDGVALSAQWQCLKTKMDARLLTVDRSASWAVFPESLSQEFVGFIEGRLRVSPPDAWLHNVSNAKYSGRLCLFPVASFIPGVLNEQSLQSSAGFEVLGRVVVPQINLQLAAAVPSVSVFGDHGAGWDEASADLPDLVIAELKNKSRVGVIRVTGIATKDRIVLAIQDSVTPGGEVFCFPSREVHQPREVLWRVKLDALWMDNFRGSTSYSEWRRFEGWFYAFHCTHGSIGIECFSVKDGSRRFSFNSKF